MKIECRTPFTFTTSSGFKVSLTDLSQKDAIMIFGAGGRGKMVHDQIMFQRPDIIISCFIALSRIISFHNLVRRISPDIVLVHYAQGLWAWLAPLAKRPVVVTVMGGDVLFDEQGRPTWMERTATGGLIRASRLVKPRSIPGAWIAISFIPMPERIFVRASAYRLTLW